MLKLSHTLTATGVAAVLALSLSACGNDADKDSATTSSTTTSTSTSVAAPVATLPTADDLNQVLAKATDPNLPVEEKVKSVQSGETAPELFETMTASKQESGADFQVVDPVLPGYTPDSVLAKVNFTLPDRPAQAADNVEFIYQDGMWKLSQSWACTLITNTVPPEQVPAMCTEGGAPAPAEEAPVAPPAEEAPAQ
ncbi:hypothetical protein SAMN05660282_00759 [Corynebacterium spheniscorum]|uniref:Low molecular weight antigen MTB12-like C-terminal domain-containing protein n=1 Tax=Corynebacterium spheniscorum TaxID=185761 RepID=A0A1I2RGX0_9CORY|nr:hypothetical protein [Corynebacterium spheniscorum]KAA8722654.1 hypothetical protein F4V56_04425 [Corynebacterium spheniscorum]SFG38749.1 hypothetical protein SAMN05660282_00759 [Corynebacterium spheniscorum]